MHRRARLLWKLCIAILGSTLSLITRADSTVVFNEVHYHPADREPFYEWVELHNQMAVSMDLSGWRLSTDRLRARFAAFDPTDP